MAVRSALYFLVVGAAFVSVATASDDADDDEDEDSKTAGLTASTMFPASSNHGVPTIQAGETTKALVTFENDADSTMQVEFMSASLSSTADPSKVVQNLTGSMVNRTVNQGEAVSMLYEFSTPKDLNPIEYSLSIAVYFMSEEDNVRASLIAFNETVTVQDSSSVFDLQSLFMTFLICGAIYLGVQHFNKKSKKGTQPKRTKTISSSVAPDADNSDYIPREHMKAVQRKGSPTRKSSQ